MPPGGPRAVSRAAPIALPPLPFQQDIHRAAAAVVGLGVAVGEDEAAQVRGVEPAGQGLAQGADLAKHADLSRFIL